MVALGFLVLRNVLPNRTWPLQSARAPTLEQFLTRAQHSLAAGQVQQALSDLNLAVGLDPGNPKARTQLGIALLESGDYPQAEVQLRYALSRGAKRDDVLAPLFEVMLARGEEQALLDLYPDPNASDNSPSAATILRGRAAALQQLGDSAGANSAITRSLSIRPDLSGFMTAARIALLQHQLERANSFAEDALGLSPNNFDALVLEISTALAAMDEVRALAIADRLVAAHPDNLPARLARINTLMATGNFQKAQPEIDWVLKKAPNNVVAHYYEAIILARQNKASSAWAIAHTLPPEFVQSRAEVSVNIADMAVAAGYLDSGAAILSAAVAKYPNLLDARLKLALYRLRQNSPQYALNVLAPVADSQDPRVAILLAQAYLKTSRANEAQASIDRAISLGGGEQLLALGPDLARNNLHSWLDRNPSNIAVRAQYAQLLVRLGDITDARVQYEQILRAQPTDVSALGGLAVLVVGDDPKRALQLAQNAVQVAPTSPDALDALGWVELTLANKADALSLLQRAHDLRPLDGKISYHLAMALSASGSQDAAKALLQVAIARAGFDDLEKAKALLASWR